MEGLDSTSNLKQHLSRIKHILDNSLDVGTASAQCKQDIQNLLNNIQQMMLSDQKAKEHIKDLKQKITQANVLVEDQIMKKKNVQKEIDILENHLNKVEKIMHDGSVYYNEVKNIYSFGGSNTSGWRKLNILIQTKYNSAPVLNSSNDNSPCNKIASPRQWIEKKVQLMKLSSEFNKKEGMSVREKCSSPSISTAPLKETPKKTSNKIHMKKLHDLVANVKPRVPLLVVSLVKVIELHGTDDPKLYKGHLPETIINAVLKEKLKVKGKIKWPHMNIQLLCGCLREFFNCLDEPLIPSSCWVKLGKSIKSNATEYLIFFELIGVLPSANKETLAFIILHLQRILSKTSLTLDELSMYFGNSLMKCPGDDNFSENLATIDLVMSQLIKFPLKFWLKLLKLAEVEKATAKTFFD